MPLDSVGLAQARSVAARLQGKTIGALYSSDLRRAAKTAELVAAALGVEPIVHAGWRERDVGQFAGLTSAEAKALYPSEWAVWQTGGGLNPPGGERQVVFQRRVIACFEEIVARHPGETVLVVSHGGAIAAVVSHALGMPPGATRRFSLQGNTGLTIVEVGDQGLFLTLLNDTSHLE